MTIGPRTYAVDRYAAEYVILRGRDTDDRAVAYAADLEWAYGQWILRPEFIQREKK